MKMKKFKSFRKTIIDKSCDPEVTKTLAKIESKTSTLNMIFGLLIIILGVVILIYGIKSNLFDLKISLDKGFTLSLINGSPGVLLIIIGGSLMIFRNYFFSNK
jgi:hypothetical protein